jgi:hypothetical protein
MPNPFGGPPDEWPPPMEIIPPEEIEAARAQYRQWDAAGPHGLVLGGNRLNPAGFEGWLEDLPESWGNIEDRRGEEYASKFDFNPEAYAHRHEPNRQPYLTQNENHLKAIEQRAKKHFPKEEAKKEKKLTPAEEALVKRRIEEVAAAFAAYGRR